MLSAKEDVAYRQFVALTPHQISPLSLFFIFALYKSKLPKKVFFNQIDIPLSDQIRNAFFLGGGGPKHKNGR